MVAAAAAVVMSSIVLNINCDDAPPLPLLQHGPREHLMNKYEAGIVSLSGAEAGARPL